jgi:arylsulfatase A-like enzyme
MTQNLAISGRDVLLRTAAGSIAVAAPDGARPNAADAQGPGTGPEKPNILFIWADDLGDADVSCYGRPDFSSPKICQFGGMHRLPGSADHRPLSILAGRRTRGAASGASPPGTALPPNYPSLPSLLRKIGYQSALLGKWHLGRLRISVRCRADTTCRSSPFGNTGRRRRTGRTWPTSCPGFAVFYGVRRA